MILSKKTNQQKKRFEMCWFIVIPVQAMEKPR